MIVQLPVKPLCRPESVAGSNHCDRHLSVTFLLLYNLHRKGIRGSVSLTVKHVTFGLLLHFCSFLHLVDLSTEWVALAKESKSRNYQ